MKKEVDQGENVFDSFHNCIQTSNGRCKNAPTLEKSFRELLKIAELDMDKIISEGGVVDIEKINEIFSKTQIHPKAKGIIRGFLALSGSNCGNCIFSKVKYEVRS